MEPELDNGSIVELVYLAAHRNEAMAVLDLLHVFLPGGLGGDLTEHGLGGGGGAGVGCKATKEGVKSVRWFEKRSGGVRRREVGNGVKVVEGNSKDKGKKNRVA